MVLHYAIGGARGAVVAGLGWAGLLWLGWAGLGCMDGLVGGLVAGSRPEKAARRKGRGAQSGRAPMQPASQPPNYRTSPHVPPVPSPPSYEADVAAKAHRSCPDSYLEAARAGDRAKARGAAGCRCLPAPHGARVAAVPTSCSHTHTLAPPIDTTSAHLTQPQPAAPPQVMECFVIDLDADAYMAAAAGPAAVQDFFLSRMVRRVRWRRRAAAERQQRRGMAQHGAAWRSMRAACAQHGCTPASPAG